MSLIVFAISVVVTILFISLVALALIVIARKKPQMHEALRAFRIGLETFLAIVMTTSIIIGLIAK